MTEHYKNLSLENITEEIDGVLYAEEWRPVVGFEELYAVSNFGRIKSFNKSWTSANGATIVRAEKIIKQQTQFGYMRVGLWKKCEIKAFQVHRLVAASFIPNPLNKPHINHVFGVKHDNRFMNLEWVTPSENELHSHRVLGKPASTTWIDNFDISQRERRIICVNTGTEFRSIQQAAIKMKLNRRCINRVCAGERKHTMGFNFKYA